MEKIPFLKPTINSIRKSIKGIDDSYNNFWDILAELIQNSVDAINKKYEKKGKIELEINSIDKSIQIYDDGIGIDTNKIPILLSPFSTDKEDDLGSIGEKGVGLKFVIFQSNSFKMKTSTLNSDIISKVNIPGAKMWKEGDSLEEFCMDLETEMGNFLGTEILVKGIENDQLFDLNFKSLKFIIRTKTAIGNVLSLFEEESNIKVSLKYIDRSGKIWQEELPFKYWLPTENIKRSDKCDLDDFKAWLSEADRSDAEKRNKLKNKIIIKQGEIFHNDYRNIKYWSCFVPKRKLWNDISIKDGLLTEDIIDDEEKMQNKISSIRYLYISKRNAYWD